MKFLIQIIRNVSRKEVKDPIQNLYAMSLKKYFAQEKPKFNDEKALIKQPVLYEELDRINKQYSISGDSVDNAIDPFSKDLNQFVKSMPTSDQLEPIGTKYTTIGKKYKSPDEIYMNSGPD
ncbi:hypothetical protein A3Q56_01656 [Intoshia linei]|uniref:Uncharacterized protein n=1 Tax=Intoshia linei TaxID=1819745 RepID=A0A177B8E2_9BILA|nr:hypothetical protein A3Q56_01656 [Intoshia linei]